MEFVGVSRDDIAQIDRCHRTPTHRASSDDGPPKPRRIHAAFTTYAAKERVRKKCIQKLKESHSMYQQEGKETKVFVAEDLSIRVIQLRKKKSQQFQNLRSEGKRPFFSYPDKLCYRDPTTEKVVVVK